MKLLKSTNFKLLCNLKCYTENPITKVIQNRFKTMANKINFSAITTDEYKNMKNFEITYGFIDTKFGPSLIGTNKDKLCYIAFHDEGKDNAAIDIMQSDWPNAVLKENKKVIKPLAEQIFNNSEPAAKTELNILVKGTDMQINIWKELTKLKPGVTTSYEQIAKAIGKPTAIRAVATAIAKNKIAYVIPCHRIINKSGNISKYRWGVQRKKDILKYENDA